MNTADETLQTEILERLASRIRAHAAIDSSRTVSELAAQHGVIFHLAEARRRGLICLSSADERELNEKEKSAALSRLRKLAVFKEVIDGLSSLPVDFVVLKGVAAEACYYPPFLQRAYTDLDLLVSEAGMNAASRFLESKAVSSHTARTDSEHSMNFFVNKTHIDLHFKLTEDRFFPGVPHVGNILNRKEIIDSCIGPLPALCRRDAFVYLILHGSKHQWCRLRWIMDVVWLAASIDRDEFRRIAATALSEAGRIRTIVALQLAAMFMPEGWLRTIAEPTADSRHLAASFEKDLFEMRSGVVEKIRNIRRSVAVCETVSQKFLFGAHLVKSLFRRCVGHNYKG